MVDDSPTLARRLAEYAHGLAFEQLPGDAVHEVKRRVLDTFGCCYGAWPSETAAKVRRIGVGCECRPGATVFGVEYAALPALAAFATGAMSRYLDFNDTYLSLEPAHPSDNIAACLAAAEGKGAGGRALITAIVLAYEVQCRLCDAASIRARGWDHVAYGSFSTALAAGTLMGLDVDRLEQAVNLAGVASPALRQTRAGTLSEWKGIAFANAARNGVFSAWCASTGLTGPAPIFEGRMGFWQQVSGEFALDVDGFGGVGRPFKIMDTCIKFWPAEYHSQSAIEAALSLRADVGAPSNIRHIDVASFDAAVQIIGSEPEKWRPTSRETADHSLPYCIAVALTDGEVGLAQFEPERYLDAAIWKLMERIRIYAEPELNARYPEGIPNRLEVATWQGAVHTREVTFPRGHARNPMTDEEVVEKYHRLAEPIIGAARAEALRELVWRLEDVDPRELMAATRVP